MTRHRSVLGRVAIAVVIGLGLPSLTAAASDGSEPAPSGPSTENSVSTVSDGADAGASESTTTTTTAPGTTTSTTVAPTTQVPATTQAPTTTQVPAPTPLTPTDAPATLVACDNAGADNHAGACRDTADADDPRDGCRFDNADVRQSRPATSSVRARQRHPERDPADRADAPRSVGRNRDRHVRRDPPQLVHPAVQRRLGDHRLRNSAFPNGARGRPSPMAPAPRPRTP